MATDFPNGQPQSRQRLSELDIVYNRSLGAYLIWRATKGFYRGSGRALPVPFAFLVLPIALHAQSKRTAESTMPASGLTMFAAKLGEQQEDLLAIHDRALALRELSMGSITAGVMVRLLHLDAATAQLLSYDTKPATSSPAIAKLGSVCEKLGGWFSRLPPEQIAATLRVAF